MKKLHILALSMLLSTSAVIMQAAKTEYIYNTDEDTIDKQRNDNSYDGSKDACDGEVKTNDAYDQEHHLNKKRQSDKHCTCQHTGKRIPCSKKAMMMDEKPMSKKSKPMMTEKSRSDRSMESLIEKMDNASSEMLEKVAAKLLEVTEMRRDDMMAQVPAVDEEVVIIQGDY